MVFPFYHKLADCHWTYLIQYALSREFGSCILDIKHVKKNIDQSLLKWRTLDVLLRILDLFHYSFNNTCKIPLECACNLASCKVGKGII